MTRASKTGSSGTNSVTNTTNSYDETGLPAGFVISVAMTGGSQEPMTTFRLERILTSPGHRARVLAVKPRQEPGFIVSTHRRECVDVDPWPSRDGIRNELQRVPR